MQSQAVLVHVLVDVPKDVQVSSCDFENAVIAPPFESPKADSEDIKKAAEMIAASNKPYIYCGGGVISSGASREVIDFAELIDAPIGCSMMGVSAVPTSNKRFLGMQGMHGHYASSMAQAEADLVIAIGARFSDRATGNKDVYVRNCNILHIDVDAAEIDKNITTQLGINGDVKETLRKLISAVSPANHPAWNAEIDKFKEKEASFETKSDIMTPYDVIDTVNAKMPEDAVIATDVGQHQMWVAQRYRFEKPRTFVSSGGLGTMGFGMGAAIGAYIASEKPVVLFTGDGSFGMNLNELATAVSCNVPLIVVIMNNGVLGMVRQWQTLFFNKHYSNTTLCRQTDFVKLAEAFGAMGFRAADTDELAKALDEAIAAKRPAVIDCTISKDEFVLPMLPPGGSIDDIITEIHGGEI